MKQKTFKRTVVSAAVLLASANASAALYEVVEVTPPNSGYASAFGVAIQKGNLSGDPVLGCFDDSATIGTCESDFALAGETRSVAINAGQAVDGISYREEAPWAMDNAFIYIQDQDAFEDYCDSELLYATCESWAKVRWDVWNDEKSGDTTPNAIAFLEESGSPTLVDTDGTNNTVINSVDSNGDATGIKLAAGEVTYADDDGGYVRSDVSQLYSGSTSLTAPSGDAVRAWKYDATNDFISGSIGTFSSTDNGDYYYTKAALWNAAGTAVQLNWPSGVRDEDDRLAQGSMRDFYVDTDTSTIYGVGYNTFDDDENYMNAAVFKVSYTGSSDTSWQTASNWTTTVVSNAESEDSDDYIYSNSKLTAINENLIAIGEAKRDGDHPKNGAANNRMFVVSDVTSPSATYFSGGIFFTGAGGKAEAINDYNEIVGQVDAENVREKDGKVRRKRAFIYPYSGTGTESTRRAIFNNQAWWLDNLTNGGTYSSANNAYRIIDASDINDAGVISATALKCDGGYDSTDYDATCGDGKQDESVVSVKLVPIPGATSSDISERGESDDSTSRSGGAFGYGALILLGFLGFRRRK
ncbi:DUF3466 family protein [Vibrio nitrifigilis]|uniref:DUF3466 family protein n=1 Tax=Vibrio nitrifigilis TaxID=2789781 RepID=A0ABS0GDK5_9VIBR|nr:DUF3466 family protein [Vibrio nitrifigilis]MBF9000471.1 DUF3466 family protein [Vibrio nitrifigilis]